MKTATLLVTDPMSGTLTSAQVDVMYRGKVLRTFQGHRCDVGGMLQKGIVFANNQGFTRTKAEYRK